MPRECQVCSHPEVVAIDAALRGQESYGQVAQRFALSKQAVYRHRQHMMLALIDGAAEAAAGAGTTTTLRSVTTADDIIAELRTIFGRARQLYDAVHEALLDPEDPGRYTLDPRAREIQVVYEEPEQNARGVTTWVKRRATLQELLDRAAGLGNLVSVSWKTADPRVLLLQVVDRLQGELELIGKLIGELEDKPALQLQVMPEWVALRTLIVTALAPFPEARSAVLAALAARGQLAA